MRVAITGASGFVGGRAAWELAARGHDVVAFGRRDLPDGALPPGVPYVRWDIGDGPLARAPVVDAVVHAAAAVDDSGARPTFERVNVAGTAAVLDTFPAAHVVHLSSASVYDDATPRRSERRSPSWSAASRSG